MPAWLSLLLDDLRFAWRGLRRDPAFAAVAIGVLALGIGANTAIFSVVDSVLLRPLPYAQPEELAVVGLGTRADRPGRGTASWLGLRDWRQQTTRSFSGMAGYHSLDVNVGGAESPELAPAVASTANLLDVLGVRPALGRGFQSGEDEPGRNRVVILSDGLWRRRFAADPAVVGTPVVLDGEAHTRVCVMGPGFRFPPTEFGGELWVPMPRGFLGTQRDRRQVRHLQVVARLAPGVTLPQARADLASVKAALDRQHPDDATSEVLTAVELRSNLVRTVRPAMLTLLAAVALVLLIACANVANLLLARATSRGRELAVRAALGAGRGRLVRQLLTESVLRAGAGASAGVLLAQWGLGALVALIPPTVPRPHDIAIDGRVLAFTAAVAVATSVIFGLFPALAASRTGGPGGGSLQARLKAGGGGTVGAGGRTRAGLLVAEVALAFLLLVGAGLALRSLARVTAVDPGFPAHRLLTAQLALPDARYAGARIGAFYDRLLGEVQALPGVEAAALVIPQPYSPSSINLPFVLPDRPPPPPGERWVAPSRFVTPGYFGLMGLDLRQGRLLAPADEPEGPAAAAVVNESFARRYWPRGDVLGQRVQVTIGFPGVRQIVGVVRDLPRRLDEAPASEMYLPFGRALPLPIRAVVLRSADPDRQRRPLAAAVASLDAQLPLGNVSTVDELLSATLQQRRLSATLLSLFGLLALLLSAAGVYGIMSYALSQRVREIGVRMALGAHAGRVQRLVLVQGMRLTAVGLAIGLGAALGASRLLESQLFGISATDPSTYAALALLLLGAAALATLLPARRATRIDPMTALRQD